MYQLNRSLCLSLTLAALQFACGRSSYRSYIYEKPSNAQPADAEAQPIVSEGDANAQPAVEQPATVVKDELPVTDGKPAPCIPATTLANGVQLLEVCPPKIPTPPKTPDTPPPPKENPSQN